MDASDYWHSTRQRVLDTYKDYWEEIRLVYEPATVRSTAHQRNQALELIQSDVIFALDDDIYMHPNSAEKIMNAYDQDADEEIAMIGGHFVNTSPTDSEAVDPGEPSFTGLVERIKQRLEQNLSLDSHFVPYDSAIEDTDPPKSV